MITSSFDVTEAVLSDSASVIDSVPWHRLARPRQTILI
jgi:hypothetical protein